MSSKGGKTILALCVLVGLIVVIPGNSLACFSWSVFCGDTSNNVDAGDYTIYLIDTSFSPGCKSTYWVSFTHDGVPMDWSVDVLNTSGCAILPGTEVILSGTVSYLFSLKVTSRVGALPGETANIITHIRATDYYNQDETKDVITTTVVNGIDQAPNPVILWENGITTSTVNLTWTKFDGPLSSFDRYEVHMSAFPDFTPVDGTYIGTVSDMHDMNFTVTGLSPESTYYFCIRVWDNDPSPGPYFADSNILEAITLGINYPPCAVVLNPPTDVTNCGATLDWTQNIDKDFDKYEIHFSTTPGFTPSIDTLYGNPLTDQADIDEILSGLTENTTYYFKVRVHDTGGLFNDSNEVSCHTLDYLPDCVILDDPFNTTVTTTELTWSQSCISDFYCYEVHLCETPGFTPCVDTKVTEIYASADNHTQITDLTESTLYYFRIRVVDLAGQYMDSNEVWDTTLDETFPSILSTIPMHNEIDVPVTQAVVVVFTESMDPSTVTYSCSPDPLGWTVTWSGDAKMVTYSHNSFTGETVYTFHITAGKDLSGNDLIGGIVPNPWSFETEDITPPEITLTAPFDGEVDVPITCDVSITFSEAMDTDSVSFSCSPDPGGWDAQWSEGDSVVTLSHTAFDSLTLYTCEITAGMDLAGHDLVPSIKPNPWSFVTVDAVAPKLVSTSPKNGLTDVAVSAPVVVTFTEAMLDSSIVFTCTPDPGGWAYTLNEEGTVVTFTHDPFESLTHYTFEITGATDIAGNEFAESLVPNPWSFDTEDAIPPLVVSVKPANGADGVQVSVNIWITFSEDMKQLSVEDALTADFAFNTPTWNGNTLIIKPTSNLDLTTEYTVTIGTEAEDLVGNHMESPFTLTFTTESINNPPEVTVAKPDNDIADDSVDILWTAEDVDSDPLTIALYYDDDSDSSNGGLILIESDLSNSGTYTWDCADVTDSNYYIYVIADDGKIEKGAYSGLLTVYHPDGMDSDGDGEVDSVDEDDDNDGIPDVEEDSNGNGIVDPGETDPRDPDSDGDGYLDADDDYPTDPMAWNRLESGDEDTFPWIWLWIVLVVSVILILVYSMYRRGSGNQASGDQITCTSCARGFVPFDPQASSVACPHCGTTNDR